MIRKPTVFVLGAGASCPYRFPAGRDLIFRIVKSVRGKQTGLRAQGKKTWLGINFEDSLQFAEELIASGLPSVDLFLENRPEYEEIGKELIAAELIPCENPGRLQRHPDQVEWLEYLFGRMASTKGGFAGNQVSFITFNYDRSVEQFFYTALKNSFGIDVDELQEVLDTVRVVHVHGQLGPFGSGGGCRPFAPEVSVENIRLAAAGIKVIHELGDDVTPEYRQAHDLLAQAEMVYFLGFGYHPENVKRLRAGTIKSYGRFAGSGFGLEWAERERAAKLIGGGFSIDEPSRDCILFLRNQPLE